MAIRNVVHVPDARLTTMCTPIGERWNDVEMRRLARDLLDTMRSFPGCVGIAAPQVGEMLRMVAIDVSGHRRARSCHGELVLIDPEIIHASGSVRMREGCLSIPDFTGDVRRAAQVSVRAHTLTGARVEVHADAWEARVILHELDHLDGRLFIDRVDSAADIYPRKTYL